MSYFESLIVTEQNIEKKIFANSMQLIWNYKKKAIEYCINKWLLLSSIEKLYITVVLWQHEKRLAPMHNGKISCVKARKTLVFGHYVIASLYDNVIRQQLVTIYIFILNFNLFSLTRRKEGLSV